MGRAEASDFSDVLTKTVNDICSMYPGVTATWDCGKTSPLQDPHMFTIVAGGSRIRLFVEHTVLLERGDSYQKFLAKALKLVTEALGKTAARESGPMAGFPETADREQPFAVW